MTEARAALTAPPVKKDALAFTTFVLTGAALLSVYLYMGRRDNLLLPVWIYLFLYAVAFGYYLYAAARLIPLVQHLRSAAPTIFAFGVFFRLAVVFAPPSISTDIYRYVWDSRLILHGINPYHYAPNAGPLKSFRDSKIWIPMEYKAYQEIYMPFSQIFFALGGLLFGNSLTGFKLLYMALDIGIMAVIWRLLIVMKRPAAWLIWYAWSPLPITEVSLAGHQDVAGILFLLLAFLLVRSPKTEGWAAFCLAAAVLTKGFVLLLLPLFWLTFGRRFAKISLLTLLVLGLPMWVRLPQFLHGMKQYLDFVNVNSGLFHALNLLLTPLTIWHFALTTKISDFVILLAGIWAARRPAESLSDLLQRSLIVLTITLLVIPSLFPWYLLWILPFFCLVGNQPSKALVLLTGLAALIYTFYFRVMTLWWTPFGEYIPFYLVLIWEIRERRIACPLRCPLELAALWERIRALPSVWIGSHKRGKETTVSVS